MVLLCGNVLGSEWVIRSSDKILYEREMDGEEKEERRGTRVDEKLVDHKHHRGGTIEQPTTSQILT